MGTVGEFASLTAEAKSGLKPCLGIGGGGTLRAFAFTTLCSTTVGHISRNISSIYLQCRSKVVGTPVQ